MREALFRYDFLDFFLPIFVFARTFFNYEMNTLE